MVTHHQWIFSASHEAMKAIESDPIQHERWRQKNWDFFVWLYGQQHIVKFIEHRDEKTPHIHAVAVPLNEQGWLTGNRFNPKRLREIQDAYHQRVSRHFGLERGVNPENKKYRDKATLKGEHREVIKTLKKAQETKKEMDRELLKQKHILNQYSPEKLQEVKEAFERQSMVACGRAYGLTNSEMEEIQESFPKQDSGNEELIDLLQAIVRRGMERMENQLEKAKQKAYHDQIKQLLEKHELPLNTYKHVAYPERLQKVIALVVQQKINLVKHKTADLIYDQAQKPRYQKVRLSNGKIMTMTPDQRIENAVSHLRNYQTEPLKTSIRHLTNQQKTLKAQVNRRWAEEEVKKEIKQKEEETYRMAEQKSIDQTISQKNHQISLLDSRSLKSLF